MKTRSQLANQSTYGFSETRRPSSIVTSPFRRGQLYTQPFLPSSGTIKSASTPTRTTVDELRAIAKSIVDSFTDIEVQVDGVPVEDIAAYRSTSPVFFSTTVEQICEAVPGTYGPMVADGYALLLAPLSVGEHTIHISGVVVVDPSDPSNDVDVDVTWHITVAPHSK